MPRATRLITHPVFLRPAFGRHHPLAAPRQGAVLDLIAALGWTAHGEVVECPLADRAMLGRFHTARYLDALEQAARSGSASQAVRERFNLGTMECPLFPGLWERALATVGGSVLAGDLALAGHRVFHPGGGTHHGQPDRASGFCYLNDPVFAVLRLLDAGLDRVLYVDLDAHHGDGVEDAFAADHRVFTISVHEAGRWPGTGGLENRGRGRARNLPVPRGINDTEYRLLLGEAVLPLAERWRAEAVVITCGADALAGDPLSSMALSNGMLWEAVERVLATAPAGLVLGGGGYSPWSVARGWAGLWGRLSGRSPPARLSPGATAVLAALECDLIDAEDRPSHWLTSLLDPPNEGPVRPEIEAIVTAVTA